MNYNEALAEANKYFNGDPLAPSVFLSKYAVRSEKGEYEESTPEQMHRRLAKAFWEVLEENPVARLYFDNETEVYNLFKRFKHIIPQGSVMSQLGHPHSIGSLSNCFVVGQPYDSYGGIFYKDQELGQLMKRRGGVGIDISTLRPEETKVQNAAGTSTGAISFMHRFSNTTREVAQNGRRGALMISIDINHPDVMEFIKIKRDLTQVTGANISIKLNNAFMHAVKTDSDYLLRFPCDMEIDAEEMSVLLNDYNGLPYNELAIREQSPKLKGSRPVYAKRIKAKEYWDEIIKSAHGVAEPGLMFWDTMIHYSPDGIYPQYRAVTTNPCSEIGMQAYDACRLIVLSLISVVEEAFTSSAWIDYEKLYALAYKLQVLADAMVDLELEKIQTILNKIADDPEPEEVKQIEFNLWMKIFETAQNSRRTGSGFTALGDMLAMMNLKYDSEKALSTVETVMKVIFKAQLNASIDLAKAHGAFEGWDPEMEMEASLDETSFYYMIRTEFPKEWEEMQQVGRRNVSWSTVAPTGTVSLMAQTTSGIEPLFSGFYMRKKKVNPTDPDARVDFVDQNGDSWQEYPVVHPQLSNWYQVYRSGVNLPDGEELPDLETLTSDEIEELFKKSPWYGSTANDINWVTRVEMQGIIQKYTTHSISSTINLPKDVSLEEVSTIYMESWLKNLKGITVYRESSRTGVLTTSSSNDTTPQFATNNAVKRPETLPVDIYHTTSRGMKWNVIVGLLDEKPYEVFAVPYFCNLEKGELSKVKRGQYALIVDDKVIDADITSSMSDEQEVITRMISTALRHGADVTFIVEQLQKSHGDVTSFSTAIARVLKKYVNTERLQASATCKECGSTNVVFEEGCHNCKDCGASGCS